MPAHELQQGGMSPFGKAIDAALPTNRFMRWIDWAMRIGIGGYDRETRRRLSIVNLAGYLSAISSLSFVINFSMYDFMSLKWLIAGNFASASITATAPFWHRFNSIAAAWVLTITVATTFFFFVSELGRDSGVQLNYIGSVAIAFVIFGRHHLKIIVFVVLLCIAGHLSTVYLFETGRVQHAVDSCFMGEIYALSATSIILILMLWTGPDPSLDKMSAMKRFL